MNAGHTDAVVQPAVHHLSRMQRWTALTQDERDAIRSLAAEQSVIRGKPVHLWEIVDEISPPVL